MLSRLFGSEIMERVLYFLLKNEKGYPSEIRKALQVPVYSVQKALERLEFAGIVVSQTIGKTRVYEFNPRSPFIPELKALLEKAYSFLPTDHKVNFYEQHKRKRPRRKGKPL